MKTNTYESLLRRMQAWCAREERCVSDIKLKGAKSGITPIMNRRIIEQLRKDGYINEKRYARAYCRGKFLMKHWGRNKIIAELRAKGLDTASIEEGMTEIDKDMYIEKLLMLISKRREEESGDSDEFRVRTARYLIQKGYEADLVWKHLKIHYED